MQLRTATLSAVLLLGAVAHAQSAENATPASLKLSSILVTLEGDSTLHRWSSQTRAVQLRGTMPSTDPETALAGDGRRELEVAIPVGTLKSESGGLDKNMYVALKKDEHPEITFKLSTWKAVPTGSGAYRVAANGTLTIAGKAREVTLDVEARVADGAIALTGVVPLKMTDFDVTPPSFFGMKAANEVQVKFNAVVKTVPTTVGMR